MSKSKLGDPAVINMTHRALELTSLSFASASAKLQKSGCGMHGEHKLYVKGHVQHPNGCVLQREVVLSLLVCQAMLTCSCRSELPVPPHSVSPLP